MDRQKGISCIECVIILLLIGLMSTIAFAGTALTQKVQFQATVKKVEHAVNYARQAAVQTGLQYNVFCQRQVILVRQGSKWPDIQIYLPEGIYMQDGTVGKQLIFRGSMAPSPAESLYLIQDDTGHQARITTRIATGKTTVYYNESIT